METKRPNPRRSARVTGYGNTADEIELSALDEARKIFGPDLPLMVEQNYKIFPDNSERSEAWHATIDVQESEPPDLHR